MSLTPTPHFREEPGGVSIVFSTLQTKNWACKLPIPPRRKKIWDIPALCHSVQCQYHFNSKLTILSLLFDQKQLVAIVIECVEEINILKSFHIFLYFLNACQNDAQRYPTCIQTRYKYQMSAIPTISLEFCSVLQAITNSTMGLSASTAVFSLYILRLVICCGLCIHVSQFYLLCIVKGLLG